MRNRARVLGIILTVFFIAAAQPSFADNASLDFLNRVLNQQDLETGKGMERLSSGRILLTDDPASYAIDQTLEKHVRGLDRMIANRVDMISYYRVQDAMLGSILDVLRRVRELVFQRTDGILTDSDRELVDTEIGQQYDEILTILSQAEFNKKKIFADLMSEVIRNNFTDKKYFQLDNVDRLLSFFITQRAATGALMKSLEYSIGGEEVARENMTAAQAHQDTEFAFEISNLKRDQLLMLVNILMLKHTGP